MRTLFILVILFLQIVLGWLFYRDQTMCCGLRTEGASVQASGLLEKPLLFSWRSDMPDTSHLWPNYKDSLLDLLTSDKKLEIISLISLEEASGAMRDSLASKRRDKTRKLFPELTDERILYSTDSMTYDSSQRLNPFEAVTLRIRTITENIKETPDGTVIYFPYNSTRELNASDVTAYLDEVAIRVIQSGERVSLAGHTDNIGDAAYNLLLSRERAKVVQQYLLKQGVSPDKILLEAKGENEPIADNSTEAGREKNRRTVLNILKP